MVPGGSPRRSVPVHNGFECTYICQSSFAPQTMLHQHYISDNLHQVVAIVLHVAVDVVVLFLQNRVLLATEIMILAQSVQL